MEQSNWKNRSRSLRVLHIMSGFGGGISAFIQNKAEQMSQYQVHFDVATYDECSDTFTKAIQSTGGDMYRLLNPKQHGWRAFKKSYTSILNAYQYDVIHCHINGYRTFPYWLLARKYHSKPFYVHAHQTYRRPDMTLSEKTVMGLNQMVDRFVSDAYLGCGVEAIKDVYGSVPKQEMMVIPNSIDLSQYDQTEEEKANLRKEKRSAFNVAEDEFVIGMIGRLMPVKNHAFAFKLASYMKEQGLKGKILIVGSGKLEKELKQTVANKQLEDYVVFTGRLTPIWDYYPMFDVLMLPSLAEGLPTLAVESQAAGIPILISDLVTTEVDFNLSLVDYLSLDDDISKWYDTLVKLSKQAIVPKEERFARIEAKRFSNQQSAELYVKFLLGEISHYQL